MQCNRHTRAQVPDIGEVVSPYRWHHDDRLMCPPSIPAPLRVVAQGYKWGVDNRLTAAALIAAPGVAAGE